ncbi:MAG: YIP1 family protein [Clostridia bacterium]|nr:YIP1 family protein [Clostridia bacterium]
MKRYLSLIALSLCLFTLLGGVASFADAYTSYTYSIAGVPVDSPDAYTPDREVKWEAMGLPENLVNPSDIVVDENENVYIVDNGKNCIYMLDKYYKYVTHFGNEFINDQGVPDSLSAPSGMYVTDDFIYVADTENSRIVLFSRTPEGDVMFPFHSVIQEPSSEVMESDAIYKPVALAVDDVGNLYVVSSTTYMGVIVLNKEGEFQSFLGAQKVSVDAADILWQSFMTAEQRAQSQSYVPTEYNNITIDDEGFVYVTSSSIEESAQQAAIEGKSSDYSPVKKLNSSGDDVMVRGGFFGPGGEVNVIWSSKSSSDIIGASKIIDVALGDEGTWSIIDEKRSKVYTYDSYGRLLHIFGDKGEMLGNLKMAEGLVYQGSKLLILDKTELSITVYERTEYGDILIDALHNDNERNYDKAVEDWEKILQRNGNFDAAYVGIGKSLYRSGKWQESMEYFKSAYDTTNYSNAFKEYRKEVAQKVILLIPVVAILVVLGLSWLFKWAAKVNKAGILKQGKRKMHEEVLYAFHLFGHPFDGFWDLKHEKRGSVRGATFWVILAVISFTYQAVGQAYLFNPTGATSSIFVQAVSILMPVFLWVTANWCLTTLMDGEGSFKDIYTAVGYSLAPLPFFVIPSVICTHFFSLNEAGVVSLLVTIGWAWVALLVVCGMMVTHGYSLLKNVITSLMTIVGMAFIMFIGLLFTGLLQKIVGFVSSIITELSYRM